VQKKVLLIGDSHSFNLRYGLDLFGRSEGVGFYSIAFAGCPPITGVKLHNQGKLRPDKSCLDFSEKLNDILFSEQYRAVIIAARWMWYYEHGEYFSRNGLPEDFLLDSTTTEISSETSRLVWRRQLFKMISKLNERKIKTVIFSQQPLLSKRIGECDKSPSYLIPMSTHSERCKVKIPLNEIMQRLKFTNGFIASLASDFVMPVKPSDYLCNKEACEIFKNGHVLYADDNHLSKAGSRYLIESIEKELSAFLAD